VKRRLFLGSVPAVLALARTSAARAQSLPEPAAEEVVQQPPFGFESVGAIAASLSARDWKNPSAPLTGTFKDLGYDQYRAIRFRREADPWKGIAGFGLDLLPPGMIFHEPVRMNLVRDGVPQPVPFDPAMLEFDVAHFPPEAAQTPPDQMGWSGFRIRHALNRPDVLDEMAVFQGASYFRVLGRDNRYGLSGRGLAIGTGSPEGEEFPVFREFWLHDPDPRTGHVTIQALLDSKSVAGGYEFILAPGRETLVTTRVALFARRKLERFGVAPLTSMFWFGPGDGAGQDDYRPAVHDSDGLQMQTGAGQWLWRALGNPAKLQISAFVDEDPRGFGLIQRSRSFDDYQDAEAHYERRPSAWIDPVGDWGKGTVTLIEIPVDSEFHDNIVSFWQPAAPLLAGERADFAYVQSFGTQVVPDRPLAKVVATRSGRSINGKGVRSFFVDFDLAPFVGRDDPVPNVTASAGSIDHSYLLRLPEQGLMRLAFEYRPDGALVADLRAEITAAEVALSESWLFRWSEG